MFPPSSPSDRGTRAQSSEGSALLLSMVSRERLLRLGATVAERATERRVRVLAQLLLVAAAIFIGLKVRSLWHGNHVDLANVDWLALAGSFVLATVGTAAGALIWLVILDGLGVKPRLRWTGLFFQAQLGKYIPGSIWQYAGRAAVARANGIPVGPVGVSLGVEFVAAAIAAGSMAGFLLGWWGALIIAAVGVVLVAGRRPTQSRLPAFVTTTATLLYLPVWLLLGTSFWLCARGLVAVPVHDLALYVGAFSVAWLAGLLAIYAPGGLGVREAVLVALLHGRIGAADALVVAAASRLMLILADVLLAGISTVTLRRGDRPRVDVADPA
jgi:glycosyltransferase 2 family protein